MTSCPPVTVTSACDYTDAALYGGWGWNPVTRESCPPQQEIAVTDCVDPDGDGWGWNGVESCRVEQLPVSDHLILVDIPGVSSFFDYHPVVETGQTFFQSYQANLYSFDSGRYSDVFMRDDRSGAISLLSTGQDGQEANNRTFLEDVSADGNTVLLQSYATNLPGMSGNGTGQLYLYDVPSEQFTAVATGVGRTPWSNLNYGRLSDDGSIVVYSSEASNIVADDTNQQPDIFLFDVATDYTQRINLSSDGTQANGRSTLLDVSNNGQYVVFESEATSLGNTGGYGTTIYRYDHSTGMVLVIQRADQYADASISDDGNIVVYQYERPTGKTLAWRNIVTGESGSVYSDTGPGYSLSPQVSPDGRYVAYLSNKTGLVDNVNVTGDRSQLYLTDLITGDTVMVSRSADNEGANSYVSQGEFIDGGRYLRFTSEASNLHSDDKDNALDTFLFEMPPGI